MKTHSDRSSAASDEARDDIAAPSTTDQLQDAADDPRSDKRTTGDDQAAENRELDPPA